MAMNCFANTFIKHFSEKRISGFSGICYQCRFYIDEYSDPAVKQLLGENLCGSLGSSVVKRKAEFVAGRYLAQKALIALDADSTVVGIGMNREPLWPAAFVGSISHTNEFAICAVANRNDVRRIGIDIEYYVDLTVAREIVGVVLTESEYRFVGTLMNPNLTVLTIIFSAKESLFKALYPELGFFFDFDVADTVVIDFENSTFKLTLVKALSAVLPVGTCFDGVFELGGEQVFTAIIC